MKNNFNKKVEKEQTDVFQNFNTVLSSLQESLNDFSASNRRLHHNIQAIQDLNEREDYSSSHDQAIQTRVDQLMIQSIMSVQQDS